MESESKPTATTAEYEPPQMIAVSLRPEEAVLGHCKTSTGTSQCGTPCAAFLCQNVGS
jgi:hypothetical protein